MEGARAERYAKLSTAEQTTVCDRMAELLQGRAFPAKAQIALLNTIRCSDEKLRSGPGQHREVGDALDQISVLTKNPKADDAGTAVHNLGAALARISTQGKRLKFAKGTKKKARAAVAEVIALYFRAVDRSLFEIEAEQAAQRKTKAQKRRAEATVAKQKEARARAAASAAAAAAAEKRESAREWRTCDAMQLGD